MIERAYQLGEVLGLAVWGMDEAGPYTTTPYPGTSWQVQTHPKRYPHQYPREGTAKMLTLFHPATGHVRLKGVTSTTNPVLHDWLKTELTAILAALPEPTAVLDEQANRAFFLALARRGERQADLIGHELATAADAAHSG